MNRKLTSALIIAIALSVSTLLFVNKRGCSNASVPDSYLYSTKAYTDAERNAPLLYRESSRIPLSLLEPHALTMGPNGTIAVVGDKALLLMDSKGREKQRIKLNAAPTCIAWASTNIFVGFNTHIEVYNAAGTHLQTWQTFGENAWLTGLAANTNTLFATDYGQRTVWQLGLDGQLLAKIDGRGPQGSEPGFVIPSPYFDLAIHNGTVWIVNPGRQRLEAYSFTGKRLSYWGKASTEIDGFCGCCNPSYIAMTADGGFVTSEKGMPRVKRYAPDGTFLGMVAPSDTFSKGTVGLDLAVDNDGSILVLDPGSRAIRFYAKESL